MIYTDSQFESTKCVSKACFDDYLHKNKIVYTFLSECNEKISGFSHKYRFDAQFACQVHIENTPTFCFLNSHYNRSNPSTSEIRIRYIILLGTDSSIISTGSRNIPERFEGGTHFS